MCKKKRAIYTMMYKLIKHKTTIKRQCILKIGGYPKICLVQYKILGFFIRPNSGTIIYFIGKHFISY